ncbi:MAG: hypothetical protein R3C15_12715 [Thermoleophilia bacterium]
MPRIEVAFSSFVVGRTSAQRPGRSFSENASSAASFSALLLDERERAEQHRGPVVRRVVEDRAGEDDPVEQRHGQARGRAGREGPVQAAGRGAVDVDAVVDAGVQDGDAEGLAVDRDRHVGDHRGVDDGVDRGAVVRAPGGQALDADARRAGLRRRGHASILAADWTRGKGQSDAIARVQLARPRPSRRRDAPRLPRADAP